MSRLLVSLCLLVLCVNMTQPYAQRYPDISYESVASNIVSLKNVFDSEIDSLSLLDASLVFVCFLVASIALRRYLWNKRLRKRISELKCHCQKEDIIIGKLHSFLEDCRSKNSAIEMPLRKMDRRCNAMASGIKTDQCNINSLQEQFQEFKIRWQKEASPVIAVPENVLLGNIESVKVKAELSMLKDYIARELKSVKFVAEYNKALLDDAVDDVDRILVSEGL